MNKNTKNCFYIRNKERFKKIKKIVFTKPQAFISGSKLRKASKLTDCEAGKQLTINMHLYFSTKKSKQPADLLVM